MPHYLTRVATPVSCAETPIYHRLMQDCVLVHRSQHSCTQADKRCCTLLKYGKDSFPSAGRCSLPNQTRTTDRAVFQPQLAYPTPHTYDTATAASQAISLYVVCGLHAGKGGSNASGSANSERLNPARLAHICSKMIPAPTHMPTDIHKGQVQVLTCVSGPVESLSWLPSVF